VNPEQLDIKAVETASKHFKELGYTVEHNEPNIIVVTKDGVTRRVYCMGGDDANPIRVPGMVYGTDFASLLKRDHFDEPPGKVDPALEEYWQRLPALVGWLRDHPTKIKMFSEWSMMDTVSYGPQKMHWFVTRRDDDSVVLPFESFIFGYDNKRGEVILAKAFKGDSNLDDEVISQAHNMCALFECFTESELEQFRAFLKKDAKKDLHVEEINLPFYNSMSGFGQDANHELYFEPRERPGYDLPFDVIGVFFTD